MTTRSLPLPKRFPGKTVARMKIWHKGGAIGLEGPIAPELARLVVAAWFGKQDPKLLARLDAIAKELQGVAKPKVPSDRALRQNVSKARASGRLGAK